MAENMMSLVEMGRISRKLAGRPDGVRARLFGKIRRLDSLDTQVAEAATHPPLTPEKDTVSLSKTAGDKASVSEETLTTTQAASQEPLKEAQANRSVESLAEQQPDTFISAKKPIPPPRENPGSQQYDDQFLKKEKGPVDESPVVMESEAETSFLDDDFLKGKGVPEPDDLGDLVRRNNRLLAILEAQQPVPVTMIKPPPQAAPLVRTSAQESAILAPKPTAQEQAASIADILSGYQEPGRAFQPLAVPGSTLGTGRFTPKKETIPAEPLSMHDAATTTSLAEGVPAAKPVQSQTATAKIQTSEVLKEQGVPSETSLTASIPQDSPVFGPPALPRRSVARDQGLLAHEQMEWDGFAGGRPGTYGDDITRWPAPSQESLVPDSLFHRPRRREFRDLEDGFSIRSNRSGSSYATAQSNMSNDSFHSFSSTGTAKTARSRFREGLTPQERGIRDDDGSLEGLKSRNVSTESLDSQASEKTFSPNHEGYEPPMSLAEEKAFEAGETPLHPALREEAPVPVSRMEDAPAIMEDTPAIEVTKPAEPETAPPVPARSGHRRQQSSLASFGSVGSAFSVVNARLENLRSFSPGQAAKRYFGRASSAAQKMQPIAFQ